MIPRMAIARLTIVASPIFLICLFVAACDRGTQSGASVHDQLVASQGKADTPPPQPARPAPSRTVATVNGVNLERRELVDLLIRSRGLSLLQQMILRETAMQEARRKGVAINAADVEQEYEYTLQADQFNGKDPDKLTPARREQLIEDWVRSRGVSRDELQLAMERQACLRKLVQDRIEVDETLLRKEYDRTYGEKVEVRHIQIEAARYYPQIKQRLERGEKFEDLARQFSINGLSKPRGGLLPPFSAADDTVPGVFVKAAFALQPGQYTNPIEAEGGVHVLMLERRIPAETVNFEDVRPTLTRHVRARLTTTAMQDLGTRLLMAAELRIEDPGLRDQYKKLHATKEIDGPPLLGQ